MSQSRTRVKNSIDGDYFFYVEGLPAFYTWGMLKDLARRAPAYPGWTEMASNPHGMQRGRGWVKVRRLKDANNLYGFFTNGPPAMKDLNVYLWSTARSPPELLKCNCEVSHQSQAFSYQQTIRSYNMSPSQHAISRSPPSVPRSGTTQPTYVYATNNGPVNATRGLVPTQSRGIFISKLDFSVDKRQLEECLNRIGSLESCDIWRDSTTGTSRGIATAKFTTTEAAAKATRAFDGQKLNGKVVKVRLDTETETLTCNVVEHRGPIIANGSR